VRTLRVIVAAYALVLILGAPALLLAAEGNPAAPAEPAAPADPAAAQQELVPMEGANQPPTAAFVAQPDLDPADDSVAVAQGESVTLDASGSSDPEGAPARFEWDLDGDGVFESDAGAGAVLTHAFATPGSFDVRLRVTDAAGATAEEKKSFTVAAPLAPEPASEPAASAGASTAQPAPEPRAREAKRQPAADDEDDGPNARAAASASVSIVDFSFRPRSVTVNVGDTVTWTNNGDQPHTATADDGSFDTGNLRTGASGSHTFDSPGTFSYICKPHPFMKGTVEVRGSGGGGGGSGGDDAGTAGTDDSGAGAAGDDAAGGSGDSLAQTGIDVLPLMGLGTLMLLMGAALGRNLPDTRP
jgi:plastocyanin